MSEVVAGIGVVCGLRCFSVRPLLSGCLGPEQQHVVPMILSVRHFWFLVMRMRVLGLNGAFINRR
jgi:hypothetical protein